MAEFKHYIYERFITKEVNSAGCYLLTFFVNGIETPVVVDDYFPC